MCQDFKVFVTYDATLPQTRIINFYLNYTVALCSGTDVVFAFRYQKIKRHFDCDADATKYFLRSVIMSKWSDVSCASFGLQKLLVTDLLFIISFHQLMPLHKVGDNASHIGGMKNRPFSVAGSRVEG